MEDIELQKNYNQLADMLVSRVSRYMIAVVVLVAAVDLIFSHAVGIGMIFIMTLITVAGLFFPSVIYDLINIHSRKLSHIVMIVIVLCTGAFYICLSSCAALLFAFPVVLSCLYNKKSICILTSIASSLEYGAVCLLKFHLLGFPAGETTKSLIFSEVIPHILLLAGISSAAFVITTRFGDLIGQMLENTRRLERKQQDMNKLISSSNVLIDAQKMKSSDELLPAVAKIIIDLTHVKTVHPFPFMVAMVKESSKDWGWDVLNYGKYSLTDKGDHIHVGFDHRTFSFDYKKNPEKTDNELFSHDIEGVSFPFYDGDELIGFAIFSTRMPVEVRESLVSAHAMITKALSNCLLNKKLFATQEELCFNLAEVCEAKSAQTGQHVKRIAKYMEIFGESLGLSPLDNKIVSVASMLHDVGKLDIPLSILDKPGKLTDEEYEIIKSHTRVGYDMLKNCSGLIMQRASMMALEHHERWDGRGYNHIKGEDIDFFSRYVAVADVFDALSSKRSYKDAWSIEDVRDEIVRCRGTQFCPDAVDRFVENFDKFAHVKESMPD